MEFRKAMEVEGFKAQEEGRAMSLVYTKQERQLHTSEVIRCKEIGQESKVTISQLRQAWHLYYRS